MPQSQSPPSPEYKSNSYHRLRDDNFDSHRSGRERDRREREKERDRERDLRSSRLDTRERHYNNRRSRYVFIIFKKVF